MARLTRDAQRFIVQELARFKTPSEVVKSVKETLGLDVTRQQVFHYNPESADVAAEWVELFKLTRAEFIKSTAAIGVSHKSYRLLQLQEMFRKAVEMKNLPLATEILEQAAKEEGGLFTNRRELTGKDGGAIETKSEVNGRIDFEELAKLPADELVDRYRDALGAAGAGS